MLVMNMKTRHVLWISIFLTGIWDSTTGVMVMHGDSGQHLIITCSYGWASNYVKYFCRDPCDYKDVLVKSNRSPNGRFSLQDFGNGTFTVTISELQESDSGLYWCAVERFGKDTYNQVNLKINKATPIQTSTEVHTTLPPTTPTAQSTSPSTTAIRTSLYSTSDDITLSPSVTVPVNTLLYAIGGVVVMVIISAVGLVAVLKYRKRVETSASHVSLSSAKEGRVEVANDVYKSEHPDAQMKSNHKTEAHQSDSVYQNINLSVDQSDIVYGNL